MKIIIIASDVHTGGGKVMLSELLSAAINMTSINFHVLVDPRFKRELYNSKNISFVEISKFQRVFYVNNLVRNLVDQEDAILNISGLPFFRRYKCTKVQYIMNRFFIDNYSTSLYTSLSQRFRLILQKFAFSLCLKNTDYIFVQNSVMKDLLINSGYIENMIEIIPYKNVDKVNFSGQIYEKSFIYVAAGEAHKNHLNLVYAWKILAEEDIYPSLFLTIDDESSLYKKILIQIQKYNLKIIIKPNLQRDELLSYYGKVSALIYPSLFECFGIPLLEASNHNLPIIASELDYVRDVVDPVETFDPNSPRSIARAVKRFLCLDRKIIPVLSAKDFAKELVLYANK
jgi:glycosyltransferase involved in cell wall biosynthesis